MITEKEFDELPEVFRLALIDWARTHTIKGDEIVERARPLAVQPSLIAEAAGADPFAFHRHCRIALLKLRAQAHDLDLDLSDFITP
jgi:hypothetical protein